MLLDIIQHLDRVGKRQESFLIMVEHIMQCKNPFIVETGMMRTDDNYEGDGMSTLLWHNLINVMKKGSYISIDNSKEAIDFARTKLGLDEFDNKLIHGDSVSTLFRLSRYWDPANNKIDLLYLDSFDMEFPDPVPSFTHIMFEFMAVKQFLAKDALICADDNIRVLRDNETEERYVSKGEYIRQYFEKIGNKPIHEGYQIVWRNKV